MRWALDGAGIVAIHVEPLGLTVCCPMNRQTDPGMLNMHEAKGCTGRTSEPSEPASDSGTTSRCYFLILIFTPPAASESFRPWVVDTLSITTPF